MTTHRQPPPRPWWTRLRDFLRPARLELREDQQDALADALRTLGAGVTEREWLVAGATERSVYQVQLGDLQAKIVCYSYEGPVLIGDRALITAVGQAIDRAGERGVARGLE